MATPIQQERQNYRKANGQYAEVNTCYRCGKSAGVNYRSDRRTDGLVDDEALCLCAKCCKYMDKLSDADFLAEIGSDNYGKMPQGKADPISELEAARAAYARAQIAYDGALANYNQALALGDTGQTTSRLIMAWEALQIVRKAYEAKTA